MEKHIDQISQELHTFITSFVAKKVKDDESVKDIVQDVFLKAQLKKDSLKDNEKLTSWLFQITRNTITDHYRTEQKALKQKFSIESEQEFAEWDYTQEFAMCVRPMIEKLPEKYRQAVFLSEIEGMSQKELALKLNISYSGAKSRVQRGRQLLKDMILQCCAVDTDQYGNVIGYMSRKNNRICR